tara:strand:+ start:2569 stop:3807 length:1239 start_codon:yes stop_codon:yes gene_type:complete
MIINFENQQPLIEGVSINDLIEKIETPFYVYSQKKITESFNRINIFNKTDIFYSVKANSNQAILTLMKKLGAGADVVSIGELKRAIEAGFDKNKIIFEGVGKSQTDLEFAINNNIRQINIESFEEMGLINSLGKKLNKNIDIGVRINPDIKANTQDKISTGRKKDKFGISIELIDEILTLVKKYNNLNLVGLSCHVGSQIHEINVFEKVFNKMKKTTDILKKNNIKIKFLDLGGGFGVTYNQEKKLDLNAISNLIDKTFRNEEYNISIEPGRFLVANAGIIITKVITSKKNSDINFLITDAGMQTLIRPALYNDFHRIIALNHSDKKDIYTVAGPICESSDIFANNIELPKQKSGDFLAICDVGAYGFVMASNYNTICLPPEILINEKNYSIIRKKENISEIIKKDIIPDWL